MTNGKPVPSSETPFERLADFTRRIVTVPKSELDKKMREYGRKKKRARSQNRRTR